MTICEIPEKSIPFYSPLVIPKLAAYWLVSIFHTLKKDIEKLKRILRKATRMRRNIDMCKEYRNMIYEDIWKEFGLSSIGRRLVLEHDNHLSISKNCYKEKGDQL